MSQDGAGRGVRMQAKSCVECRRRKIRCIWPTNSNGISDTRSTACEHCLSRGRPCVLQSVKPRSSNVARTTAKDRIRHLEEEMASLAALVRERQSGSSSGPSTGEEINEGSVTYDDLAGELERIEVENTSPPSHVRLLFDKFAVEDDGDSEGDRQSRRLYTSFMRLARSKLQPLIPSREQVSLVAQYASHWMPLYHSLFPPVFAFRTGEQLVVNYDRMRSQDVHPVPLAMFLLSVAITAQQMPSESVPASFHGGQGVRRFIDAVCRSVDQTIIGNNALAGSPEGLETAMLYVRLALGRSNLKSTWLTFRRIVALAELAGLPQANEEVIHLAGVQDKNARLQSDLEALTLKADVWEAICATDRNYSMMLNFPAATARYRFPRNESVLRDGRVVSHAYNYQLSKICASIVDIDESYVRGRQQADSYEKVLRADHQMRALAASVPKAWWRDSEGDSIDELLVRFWHDYILARIHLRPGMIDDADEEYAYSRTACRDACFRAVRRYPEFRTRIPSGFFVCRVLDIQVFTAATFLLLTSESPQEEGRSPMPALSLDSRTTDLLKMLIGCLESVSNQAGSDLAREAKNALTSLIALAQAPGSGSLNVQIPLLGKIRIGAPSSSAMSERSSVEAPDVPPSSKVQIDLSDGNTVPTTTPNDGIVPPHGAGQPAAPISWSFEFDDPSFWSRSSVLPDDMGFMSNWMEDTSMGDVPTAQQPWSGLG